MIALNTSLFHFYFMAGTIATKLKIKAGDTILAIGAPGNYTKDLGNLPQKVTITKTITKKAGNHNQVHWFVENRMQMEKKLSAVLKQITGDVIWWIFFPKGSSSLQTDLTRDKGWDKLLAQKGLKWLSLISFNETWSAFAMRRETEKDRKEVANKPEREIFNWIDSTSKTVKVPPDLNSAFKKNKKAVENFEKLSFTNKKEYVEWIVTAKKEETRATRVAATLERLEKGWKNPRNL